MIQLNKTSTNTLQFVILISIFLVLFSLLCLGNNLQYKIYWYILFAIVLALQCYFFTRLHIIIKKTNAKSIHAHTLLHSISEGILILKANLVIEFFNKKAQKILFENFSVNIEQNRNINEVFNDYAFHFLEEVINRLHDVSDVLELTHQFLDTNNQPITFKIIAKKVIFNQFRNTVIKYYFTFHNITEQIQLHKISKRQQNQIDSFLRKSDIAILIVDEKFIIKETNYSVVSLFGYTEQNMYNTHLSSLFYSEHDFEVFKTEFQTNNTSRFIYYFKNKSCNLLYLHITCFTIQTNYTANAICLIITENEEVVSKSVYLEEAGEMAKLGWWYVDFNAQKVTWSDETKKIHGVDKYYEPDLKTAINFYKNEAYRDLVSSHISKTFEARTPFNLEAEITTKQGVNKWVRALGKPKIIDEEVVGIFGVFQDIELQKKTEKQLITKDEEIYALFDQNAEAIISIDTNGIITSANKAMQILSELSLEQIKGRKFTDFVSLNKQTEAIQYFKDTIRGKACQFEIESSEIEKDKKYHLQVSSMPTIVNNIVVGAYIMVQNISKEKRLLQEVSMLSKVASFSNSLVLIINNQFNVIWVNNTFLIKTGYKREQLLYTNVFNSSYIKDNSKEVKEYMYSMINLATSFNTNFILTTVSNELLFTKLQVIAISSEVDSKNNECNYILIAEDITVEETLIKKLKKSDDIFKGIFDKNTAAIIIWDPKNGKIINVNAAFLEIYKYQKMEVEEMFYWDILFLQEDKELDADVWKEERKQGVNLQKHIRADGSSIYLQTTSHIAEINEQKVVITIAADATKEIELKKEIEQERQQKINEINASVIKAQDKEREFIGQELHDNINQLLVSSKLYLELYKKETKEKHTYIEKTYSLLDGALTEIRSLSHDLISPFCKISSLAEAISQMALITSKVGEFKLIVDLHKIDEYLTNTNHQTNLYRIAQEQFSNILKHAKASEVELVFIKDEYKKKFTIKDNGTGFNTNASTQGIGLKNIVARCKMFNWNCNIVSTSEKGCALEIIF